MKPLLPLLLLLTAIAGNCIAAGIVWAPTATKSYVDNHPDAARAVAAKKTHELGADVHVPIVLGLKLRNQESLDKLTASGTAAPLTTEQFNQTYAPTDADTGAVVAYLTTCGFANISVAPNHLIISADGTVASIKQAFNTALLTYVKDGKTVFVNASDAMVPSDLAQIILSVGGLQNADRAHTMRRPVSK